MSKKVRERMHNAVAEGQKARSEYYQSIDLKDEQELGEPATEEQLVTLEKYFGKRLPPYYRIFLNLYNGWKMGGNASMDLLSIEEQTEGQCAEAIKKFRKESVKHEDFIGARSLVIGFSAITSTKLLLDPESVDEQGEWAVVQHHDGEEGSYSSFINWLEESIKEFRNLSVEADFDDIE